MGQFDDKPTGYVSSSGFKMYGGTEQRASSSSSAWVGVGMFAGIALLVTTYLALSG